MSLRQTSQATVTIPRGCSDEVVPLSDPRAESLTSTGVNQVALSSLVAGFVWPGPDPRTHLVLATIEGNGRLLVGGDEYSLRAGSVAVCPAHTPRHQWAEEPWRVVTIRLSDSERWRRLRETGPFVLDGSAPRFAAPTSGILAELPPTLTAVADPSEGHDPLDTFIRRFAGHSGRRTDAEVPAVPTSPFELYALILRMQLETLLAGPPPVDADESRLHRLWDAVRREPGGDWSIEALARHLNMSRASLHRLVTERLGASPGSIVDRIRMDHAARLLAHGDLPVKAIAAQVGYATPYSFSAAFHRRHGCSPSAFRSGRR